MAAVVPSIVSVYSDQLRNLIGAWKYDGILNGEPIVEVNGSWLIAWWGGNDGACDVFFLRRDALAGIPVPALFYRFSGGLNALPLQAGILLATQTHRFQYAFRQKGFA